MVGVISDVLPTLLGTFSGEWRRVAWFEDLARVEGEVVKGLIVKKIFDDHVILGRGSEEFEVWIGE